MYRSHSTAMTLQWLSFITKRMTQGVQMNLHYIETSRCTILFKSNVINTSKADFQRCTQFIVETGIVLKALLKPWRCTSSLIESYLDCLFRICQHCSQLLYWTTQRPSDTSRNLVQHPPEALDFAAVIWAAQVSSSSNGLLLAITIQYDLPPQQSFSCPGSSQSSHLVPSRPYYAHQSFHFALLKASFHLLVLACVAENFESN